MSGSLENGGPIYSGTKIDPCESCEGMGYYHYGNLEPGHPYFGVSFPCSKCNQATIDNLCGLKPHERSITLLRLDTRGRPGTTAMFDAALQFTTDPRGFLSIHGKFGNGKTTALMAIVNVMIDKGIQARYLTASALLAYMRETFNPATLETDYDRIHELSRIPVLCIDEMDKLRDTPYSRELQQELINLRYRDSGVLGTVLAWNGGMDSLPWEGVRSRLSEFMVVENNDPDMRSGIGSAIRRFMKGSK